MMWFKAKIIFAIKNKLVGLKITHVEHSVIKLDKYL